MTVPIIHPVILSGGSGTRLWPLSRTLYPKQLLSLSGRESAFQQTLSRVADGKQFDAPLIIANEEHRFIIAELTREAGVTPRAIVLEPVPRSTAPAACIASLIVAETDPHGLTLMLPSDHVIEDRIAFHSAVNRAAMAASSGLLVTFGISPDRPETDFGYIRRGASLVDLSGAFAVAEFIEKPDAARAEQYFGAAEYFWNSGMFLFRASTFIEELERVEPEMVAFCRSALGEARRDLDFVRLDEKAFGACPTDSIDFAVMERTDRAATVIASMGWNDIGSWDALWRMHSKDADGNAIEGNVVAEQTRGCYLRSEAALLATIGVDNLVVVATDDAIMVSPRDRSQDVKRLVAKLRTAGRSEVDTLPTVHRPWGSYKTLHAGHRVQVKHIIVKPGAKLSLQMHHHRAEHWVIVEGTAKIVCGDKTLMLSEDQSTYIPVGTPHRLENPGMIALHVIEVQSGSYLGEDDIVRFEDSYGRATSVLSATDSVSPHLPMPD